MKEFIGECPWDQDLREGEKKQEWTEGPTQLTPWGALELEWPFTVCLEARGPGLHAPLVINRWTTAAFREGEGHAK